MADYKKYDYTRFFAAVRDWQVNVMQNNCTSCYGENMQTQCRACGWWGKVNPHDPEAKLPDSGPDIEDYALPDSEKK